MRASKAVEGFKVIVKRTAGYSILECGDIGEITEVREWRGFTIIRVTVEGKPNTMNWARTSSVRKYRENGLMVRLRSIISTHKVSEPEI